MKKAATFFLCLLLLFSLSAAAFAAHPESLHVNYITDVFNEGNGLPTGEANAILQARNSYLWIGSYGGLLRYDGSTFADFSDRLESTAIRSLFEAGDGALYVGTNDAGAYRFVDDVFTPLRAADEYSFLCVRAFVQAPDGTVRLASPSGAAKIVGDTLLPYDYAEMRGMPFRAIAVDAAGNTWAMSDSGDLCIFNDERFLTLVRSDELFDGAANYTVGSDGDGAVYVGSSDGRIVRLRMGAQTVPERVDSYLREDFSAGGIGSINQLKAVYDGTILVSALNGFGFLDEQGRFHRIDQEADNILSANCAELDHEGNRWVASSNYGVIRYSIGCFDSCNYNSALGDYTVNAVAKQGDRFYVGTDGGLMLFDTDWHELENSLTETLEGIRVRSINVDTAGLVWMATYSSHGALCYDPATDTITDFGQAQGLGSEKVRVVYPLSDGRMLVGDQLGVSIIENGAITKSYSSEDGMETTSVLCAMELLGHVYVGTDGSGIYEITDGGLVNLGFAQGLSQGVVLRMEPDADGSGNFFVCAGDKLFYYENGSFRVLSGIDIGSGSIYSIYDVGGRIWMLQNGGVFSADKAGVLAGENVYTAQYGVKCGLTGTLNANTWNWLDETGSLYIPTRGGVSLFHFKGPDITMPRAILNSVTVDDRLFEHPETLTLAPDAKRMTVDISELLFSDTSEYILGYQLEGFDTEEAYTMDKHVSVSYTNLKGGVYTLKIRIIDPLTGVSTTEHALSITKQKRLTEHVWFYILCGLLAAFCIEEFVRLFLRRKTRVLMKKQEEQQRYIDDITKVFSECVDMRDAYTNGHSARVAKYTAMLARELGKSPEEVERMYSIALLHDVGKISIPDAVLNKPARLTDEEYDVMKSHASRGYEVLKSIEIDPELALGAGSHHERYDGKGYPNGLKGDEIPEVAQIIAVADAFDAMYSTRPYRKKMALGDVVEEIRRCSGTQLSPRVVDAFLRLVEAGAFDDA